MKLILFFTLIFPLLSSAHTKRLISKEYILNSSLKGHNHSSESLIKKWYKGNTHSHTKLSGHADSTPSEVVNWYHKHDYNFLVLSEHNRFIDPNEVELPRDLRDDFILIPGQEITGVRHIHTTAMNITKRLPWSANYSSNKEVIQAHVDSAINDGGVPILNHPNWQYSLSWRDILGVRNLKLIELYNGHPDVNNWGDSTHLSVEQIWDNLLTTGMHVYGVSSDDAHVFKQRSSKHSNPGRGWVMVQAEDLTPHKITDAMQRGDFYSTNGVILSEIEKNSSHYKVAVDKKATKEIIDSPWVIGRKVDPKETGFRIDFIGPRGRILSSSNGLVASFHSTSYYRYVRVKVTYTVKTKNQYYEFYAWGQPYFSFF